MTEKIYKCPSCDGDLVKTQQMHGKAFECKNPKCMCSFDPCEIVHDPAVLPETDHPIMAFVSRGGEMYVISGSAIEIQTHKGAFQIEIENNGEISLSSVKRGWNTTPKLITTACSSSKITIEARKERNSQ